LWWDANGWHHHDPTGDNDAPNATGDPAAYVFAAQGTQHVVYRGAFNHIYELWWLNGDWHHKDVTNESRTPTPNTPTGLQVTNVADRIISVSWMDQSADEDGFLVRFRGKRAGESDHTGTKSVGRNQVSTSLTGLRSNYEYTISVVAFNAGGESPSSNEVRATTPARSISVSKEGTGASAVFVVTGAGFTAGSGVVLRITGPQFQQVQFPETAGGDGKFVSRHSVPCVSAIQLTFTAFEDADPLGTSANAIVTTCP
jgi:hypothetical protein